jgi:protein-tyrosine-phosphatase
LSFHRSARVTRDQLASADLVIAMDLENRDRLRQEFPEMASRTTLLGLFGSPETLAIADPYLADEAATNRICEQVRGGVEGLGSWVDERKRAASTSAIPTTATGGR